MNTNFTRTNFLTYFYDKNPKVRTKTKIGILVNIAPEALSPVSMYAGCGSGKNPSYRNAQQCFHFCGLWLWIVVAGGGECGPLFSIRSLTNFFHDPLAAGGNRDPLLHTWERGFMQPQKSQ